jgi:hypothetical protein
MAMPAAVNAFDDEPIAYSVRSVAGAGFPISRTP